MEGVVVAISPFFACGKVVPGVGETDTVAVTEVQVEPDVGGATGEEFEHRNVSAEQHIENIVQGIHHVGVSRTDANGIERQGEVEEGGQPRVCGIGLVVGEVALHSFLRTEFVEKGDGDGCVLEVLQLFQLEDVVGGDTGPEMPTLDGRIQTAVEEFQFRGIGAVGTIYIKVFGLVARSEELQVATLPLVGDTDLLHVVDTAVGERNGALVEAVGAADAGIEVDPEPVGLGIVIIRALGERAPTHRDQGQYQQWPPNWVVKFHKRLF